MQKDIHFYLTYALARKVGICAETAEIIAWADQYTDDLTKADLYGIQTQSAILGNWKDRQIQLSVLVPFHFIPGEKLWMVKQNSKRAKALIDVAIDDPIRFGIALHGLQDTFSHQGFTGWEEKCNACYWFSYIPRPLPNVGHTDMGMAPDIVNAEWYDPRTKQHIDNRVRAMSCAAATYGHLWRYAKSKTAAWPQIAEKLETIFGIDDYDQRKEALCRLSGDDVRYSKLKPRKVDFIKAARLHLADFIKSL